MKFGPTFRTLLVTLAIIAGGCAHEPPDGPGGGGPGGGGPGREGPPPGPPPFLSGPVGTVLSKNAEGFVARVAMDIQTPEGRTETLSGELMGRERKLLFTPEASGARGKRLREAKISFIWDTADHRGFMLSEALQACAPISANGSFSLAESPLAPGIVEDKVDGHPCQAQAVTATSADGSTTSLRVWRATDLKGLTVQVAMQPDLARPVFHLSKIRPATPPLEVFEAPEGFTKYRNVEAMMNELRLRQQGMKRKSPEGPEGEHGPPGSPPNNSPTRSY